MPRRGRKLSLTKAKLERVVGLVKAGIYEETAAESIGVTRWALRRWMRKGFEELDRIERGEEPSTDPEIKLCVDCAEQIFQARAESESKVLAVVIAGIRGNGDIPPDPRLALDYAARRWPTKYSERAKLAARELIDEDLSRLKSELDEETFARVAEILTRRDS